MAQPLMEKPAEELSATELVLRLYAHNQRLAPEEHARLRTAFEQVLEREPNHADAWAALATIYWGEQMHGLNPLPDPLTRARAAAERAVRIDSANQSAWESLAEVQYFTGDLVAFRQSAERVIGLNRRNASALAIMAMLIAYSGEWDRGYELIQRAMALNPHHAGWFHFVPANTHFKRGDYEAALAAAKRVNMPDFPWTYSVTAIMYAALGRWDEARANAQQLRLKFPAIAAALDQGGNFTAWIRDAEHVERQTRLWLQIVAGPSNTADAVAFQSIAVLPFACLSADEDDNWFSDGMTEEIINVLAQLDGLKVAARTSCFAFKGKDADLRVVGEKLGVQHVLEGSVRKVGSRVRITAQLIKAADGYHLWSERYDRELVDIFAVQDELANAIAAKLQLSLLPSVAPREAPRNLEAY
jgi:TolB-like protein/Tfp pilus assembly protein PilF